MSVRTCLFVLSVLITHLANAAPYIVKLKSNTSVMSFEAMNSVRLKEISKELGLYEAEPIGTHRGRSQFKALSSATFMVPNHPVQLRSVAQKPNDTHFDQQWSFLLDSKTVGINVLESWQDFGVGGRDVSGNEIVVAIVDGGFDHNHPDLYTNRWRNRGEIANNGKDDDGNGYTDDVYGWNASANNGMIEVEDHGTMVAGIIGARGNNKRGVAGINQRVKIMYVSAGVLLADTAATMRAYSYILKQKQLWLQSGGKKGANVVAVNSSFGIDAQDCAKAEFAVWNDMINALGKSGILSVGATANNAIDIDKDGDIPTSCDSPFQIAVTNSRKNGSKYPMAGFGPKHIDIAAPGDTIFSTAQRIPGSTATPYDASVGTSFSAPHVAGAVGYLHSAASVEFNNLYLNDPAAAALELKRVMLETVTPIASLQKQVGSGGVLNLHSASVEISEPNLFLATTH